MDYEMDLLPIEDGDDLALTSSSPVESVDYLWDVLAQEVQRSQEQHWKCSPSPVQRLLDHFELVVVAMRNVLDDLLDNLALQDHQDQGTHVVLPPKLARAVDRQDGLWTLRQPPEERFAELWAAEQQALLWQQQQAKGEENIHDEGS